METTNEYLNPRTKHTNHARGTIKQNKQILGKTVK
jgi:hypothetical protein